ncbi:hypothetical protein [Streptomyces lichenis]
MASPFISRTKPNTSPTNSGSKAAVISSKSRPGPTTSTPTITIHCR